MSLTTLPFVKSVLNVPLSDTTQDPWLSALWQAAEKAVKSYCKQKFEYAASYVEYYDGNSQPKIPLRQRPVYQVNNVWVDFAGYYGQGPGANNAGPFSASTVLTNGQDYVLEYDGQDPAGAAWSKSGNLIRVATIWSEVGRVYYPGKLTADLGPAPGCIKVDYAYGFKPGQVPYDLQLGVAYTVAAMKRDLPAGGVVAEERIGEYSYKLEKANRFEERYPEIGSARSCLSSYREVCF
jgi:hypothetical protein